MDVQQILEAALELDPADRESLVAQLIESLIGEPFASDEIERAWLTEVRRRSAEIDAGQAEIVDWTDVRSRLAARRA